MKRGDFEKKRLSRKKDLDVYVKVYYIVRLRKESRRVKCENLMHIGQLAEKTGVTPRTLRYYEELGMIHPEDRSEGSFRLYSERQLMKVRMIHALKALDFPLTTIRDMMTIHQRARTGGEAANEVLKAVELQLRTLEHKLSECEEMKRDLKQTAHIVEMCVACERDSIDTDCEACYAAQGILDLPLPVQLML